MPGLAMGSLSPGTHNCRPGRTQNDALSSAAGESTPGSVSNQDVSNQSDRGLVPSSLVSFTFPDWEPRPGLGTKQKRIDHHDHAYACICNRLV